MTNLKKLRTEYHSDDTKPFEYLQNLESLQITTNNTKLNIPFEKMKIKRFVCYFTSKNAMIIINKDIQDIVLNGKKINLEAKGISV